MKTTFGWLAALLAAMLAASQANSAADPVPSSPAFAVAAGTRSSVNNIVQDMLYDHEGLPRGIYYNGEPSLYWVSHARVGMGNSMPAGWSAFIAWGQIYADRSGITAPNTRFQLRRLWGYYLSRRTGTWQRLQATNDIAGSNYAEDFANDANVPADIRYEPSGGISSTVPAGYNFHFFPQGRVSIDPNDIAGIWTCFEARLVLNNPNGPDDRANAHLLGSVGADYWKDLSAPWDQWKTNGDVGIGRFKYLTNDWRVFNMHTLTEAQLRQNPPPFYDGEMEPEPVNGVYKLTARHSGKVLDVAGGASTTANGTAVQQWNFFGSSNQLWRLTATGSYTYKFVAQHSGKALDVVDASTANGARIQQYTDNGTDAQRWKLEATGDGYYTLTSKRSGKVLDISGGPSATANGAAAIQWDKAGAGGSSNQQWKLELVSATASRQTDSATPAASVGLSAYPNPSPDGRGTLRLHADRAQRATVAVRTAQGALAGQFTVAVAAGQTKFRLPVSLPAGTYYLQTTLDGEVRRFTLKVL